MWSQSLKGKTCNFAYIFKIKQSTAEAAAHLENASPAIRLWAQYAREAPTFTGNDAGFRGRMKLMMKVDKGLPRMFQRYNGKPTLLTKSSRIAQGENYLEGKNHALF